MTVICSMLAVTYCSREMFCEHDPKTPPFKHLLAVVRLTHYCMLIGWKLLDTSVPKQPSFWPLDRYIGMFPYSRFQSNTIWSHFLAVFYHLYNINMIRIWNPWLQSQRCTKEWYNPLPSIILRGSSRCELCPWTFWDSLVETNMNGHWHVVPPNPISTIFVPDSLKNLQKLSKQIM